MTRKKPKDIFLIDSPEEAQEVMQELLNMQLQLDRIETNMNASIEQAKKKANDQSGPVKLIMKAKEAALKNYADRKKEDLFKSKRTIYTLYGSYGFRKSSELKPLSGVKLADVAETCLEKGYTEAVKTTHKVQKDVVRQWPESKIEEVKCRLVEKDTFGYELDKTALDKEGSAA